MIKARFNKPQNVRTKQGKRLANTEAVVAFRGVEIQSSRLNSTLQSIRTLLKVSKNVGYMTAAGVLTVSSLFTTSLSGLSQFIQIIEFSMLMELFNFEFDTVLGGFFESIRESSGLDLLPMPINDWASGLQNSVAGIWKGKLSRVDFDPYLFQEVGYLGLLSLVKK